MRVSCTVHALSYLLHVDGIPSLPHERLAYTLRTPVTWNMSGRKYTAGVWVCVRGPALPRTEAGCGRD